MLVGWCAESVAQTARSINDPLSGECAILTISLFIRLDRTTATTTTMVTLLDVDRTKGCTGDIHLSLLTMRGECPHSSPTWSSVSPSGAWDEDDGRAHNGGLFLLD